MTKRSYACALSNTIVAFKGGEDNAFADPM